LGYKKKAMMKNKAEQPKKWGTSVLLAAMLLTVLSLSQPAFSQVNLAGSWATGTSHTKEAGTDRALIFIAHGELTSSMNLSNVSYGGQSMTKVIDRNYYSGSGAYAYAAAYILNEAGVAAASSGTFTVTWSATPSEVKYASVFLSNVNQTTLVGASASGGGTSNPVTTSALATSNNDMVIDAATCGNTGTYTLNNGFTQGTYQSSGSSTGVTGYKSATGASETPSASHSNINGNRQVIIGFVVNGTAPDPNKASNPDPFNGATNVGVTTDLSWTAGAGATSHDVYFGTDSNAHNNPKHTVDTNSYDPPGDLEIDTTYYWAVDSNANGTIYPGDDWNFTTLIPVQVGDRVAGNMMLINDNGGWCWYQDDKIIYDPVGGNILVSTAGGNGFGGVSGTRTNDMDTTTFNIATGKRTRVVAREGFGGDDHNMGAFWIRPDGRYLHVYAPHYSANDDTYFRLATYPNDGSAWGSEHSYNWKTIPGPTRPTETQDLSYTNVHYLSGEGTGKGRLYNIARVFTRTPNISYSDNWGDPNTWKYMGRLNKPVGGATYSNFYHKFRGNGVDRIDFIGCENHPRNYNNSIYHGYIKGGKAYNSYGTIIDSNLFNADACSIQAFTPVFIADQSQGPTSYHTGWTNEIELDKNGFPVCLFQTRYGTQTWGDGSGQNNIGAADHRFFYGRFDGSNWHITELCKMGTGLHTPEQDYLGIGCIHPDDANLIYVSTPFDPRDDSELEHHEIFKGVTYDNGATWDWTQITIDSTEDNIRPAIPKWDAYNTAVFWTRGSYPGQENYDFVVVGMVEEENVTLGLVNYIDASPSNTKNADDTNFAPTGPSGNAGTADSRWHEYTGYGNGGSCYTAGDGGTENVPTIKTTITGLSDGTYDVFAYFWCDPNANWGIRGGFESSDLLCFNKQSSQFAEASQFSGPVDVIDTEILYRVYIGRKEVSGGALVDVYIDNYDSSFSGNVPTRTTYDGVGVASVITGAIPGDLNGDGKVNLIDIAVLGQGWLTTYDIDTLADIADNWLFGT
jgi:hypothetical protein